MPYTYLGICEYVSRVSKTDCEKEEVNEMVANNAFMIEEMKAKAEKEGKAELLINLLIKKLKELPEDYKKKLMNLPEKTIDEIGIQIFEMESIEELKKYFYFRLIRLLV